MRNAHIAAIVGFLVSVLGAIVSVVYLFQPWRSCEYEDTAAGCSMLPADAAVMMVALFAIPLGLVVAIVGLTASRRHRSSVPAKSDPGIDDL